MKSHRPNRYSQIKFLFWHQLNLRYSSAAAQTEACEKLFSMMISLGKQKVFHPQLFWWPGRLKYHRSSGIIQKEELPQISGRKRKNWIFEIFLIIKLSWIFTETHHKKWWVLGFCAVILLILSFIFIAFCFHINGTRTSHLLWLIVPAPWNT